MGGAPTALPTCHMHMSHMTCPAPVKLQPEECSEATSRCGGGCGRGGRRWGGGGLSAPALRHKPSMRSIRASDGEWRAANTRPTAAWGGPSLKRRHGRNAALVWLPMGHVGWPTSGRNTSVSLDARTHATPHLAPLHSMLGQTAGCPNGYRRNSDEQDQHARSRLPPSETMR